MFDFIRNHQMNIMLCLCAACFTMVVMLLVTKFLSKRRKWILIAMEINATLLLFFDRLAYIYAGNLGNISYIMVRFSNFMVFFLTAFSVLCFNYYLIDLLENEGKLTTIPRRLIFTGFASAVGMLLAVISAFTGLYYYFDSNNIYHRGSAFIVAYIIPVICPVIQFSAIVKHKKSFSKFIIIAVALYIFVPIVCGIIQIFTYGISIVNMSMVLVSVFLYMFSYLDVNSAVEKAHEIEIQTFKDEQKKMIAIFGQASEALSTVIEKNSESLKGHAERTANLAKELAKRSGKSEEDCDKIYYSALLCDAGEEALSRIKVYPFLVETARYVGKDYSEDIPEFSRIITVAKAFDSMINNPEIPPFFVRDYFIREAGTKYDPVYAKIIVQILDGETNSGYFEKTVEKKQSELVCKNYRDAVTTGIDILQNVTEISFECEAESSAVFSAPSIILFDSSDGRVQRTPETIDSHKYLEYGEVWFDAHIISTGARNMEIRNIEEYKTVPASSENTASISDRKESSVYKIIACRYEDHLLIKMMSTQKAFEVIVALPSASKSAFLGITGENVHIKNIKTEITDRITSENDIPRIAEKINYIDRIESDVPNVQIVKPLALFTKGIEIKESMKIYFHAQSLPDANLVWHCPYIILYYSDDKKVYGKNYREYAMIKFDGEENGSNEYAENDFLMKKTENFTNWEDWEAHNKAGYECQIEFIKNGNEVTLRTQNKGIYIQNTTRIRNGNKEIFVAFSGDQVALTDIRIR